MVKCVERDRDPGNTVRTGELDAFPNGRKLLPKNRIYHCQVKNAVKVLIGAGVSFLELWFVNKQVLMVAPEEEI